MTIQDTTLDLDLGPVGSQGEPHPFRVILDAAPLARLVADAAGAFRVHEFLLVDRPGDVWDYVQVTPVALPPPVAARLEQAGQAASAGEPARDRPDAKLPFRDFDRLFRWAGDDTDPEDEAWIRARDDEPVRAYARALLASVASAREALETGSILQRHEIGLFRAHLHPFSLLDREGAIRAGREHAPGEPRHTQAFYDKLGELLGDRDVVSVSYRGEGDFRIFRMLCEAQRDRASRTGQPPALALEISALVDREAGTAAWGAEVTYFEGEQEQGFLHVEEPGARGESVRNMVERYTKIGPGGYILSSRDEGNLRGYRIERGEGWHLYRSDVSPRMSAPMRRYHNVWSLMRGQENGEVNDEQVVEIMALWAEYLSWRVQEPPG